MPDDFTFYPAEQVDINKSQETVFIVSYLVCNCIVSKTDWNH